MLRDLICELQDLDLQLGVPMSQHTTFRIGGKADAMLCPRSAEEILRAVAACQRFNVPFVVIGNGSNLLVKDGGIRGLVIKIGPKMSSMALDGETAFAQAGARLSAFVSECMRQGLCGLAFAGGIPGTVGGGVLMNAGAYGSELKDVLTEVEYIDPKKGVCGRRAIAEGDFEYRSSIFAKNGWIVTGARFRLRRGAAETERALFEEYQQRRREKQPLNLPSAGSVFKRPSGHFAGALIEQAGLKGAAVGGAQVSKLHAGFIVNTGGATAADVLALIERIKKDVRQAFGVSLEEELKVIGE